MWTRWVGPLVPILKAISLSAQGYLSKRNTRERAKIEVPRGNNAHVMRRNPLMRWCSEIPPAAHHAHVRVCTLFMLSGVLNAIALRILCVCDSCAWLVRARSELVSFFFFLETEGNENGRGIPGRPISPRKVKNSVLRRKNKSRYTCQQGMCAVDSFIIYFIIFSLYSPRGGGGGLPYVFDRDARRLA